MDTLDAAVDAGDDVSLQRDDLLESLEIEVAVLVRRARRVIALRAAMVHPDLLPTSYVVLTVINERGPLRASQIAEMFSLDKGAVSRQVQQLADLGLITREQDSCDRRAQVISLTDDARARLAEIRAARRVRLRSRLGDWEDDRLDDFVGSLRLYNSALAWIDDAEIPNLHR